MSRDERWAALLGTPHFAFRKERSKIAEVHAEGPNPFLMVQGAPQIAAPKGFPAACQLFLHLIVDSGPPCPPDAFNIYSPVLGNRISRSIIEVQKDHLFGSSPLCPINAAGFAAYAGLSNSTVSRLAPVLKIAAGGSPRYLEDLLSSEFVARHKGQEVPSGTTKDQVRVWLNELIDRLGPSVSSQELADQMQRLHGIAMARRTVAKYRWEISRGNEAPPSVPVVIGGTKVETSPSFGATLARLGVTDPAEVGALEFHRAEEIYGELGGRDRDVLTVLHLLGPRKPVSVLVPRQLPPAAAVEVRVLPRPRTEENPFLVDRVDTPFEAVKTDLFDFNRRAYEQVKQEIGEVRESRDKKCRGVLILGEAGTGKTHLLFRLHQDLSEENHMLFVPRPTNPDGVFSHIWSKVFESLNQKKKLDVPVTQGEILLRSAFCGILEKSLQADSALGDSTRTDWGNLINKIRRVEALGEDLDRVRNRVISFYSSHHGSSLLHMNFIRGFFNYLAYSDKHRRQTISEYLKDFEIDADLAASVGMRAWREISENSGANDLLKSREDWALEGIRVVSELASYERPLILAFDQLEGLRDREQLTREWGHAVQEIMTHCRNLVVVCCIFPHLWKEWFTSPGESGFAPLEDAVQDRIAASRVDLDPLTLEAARSLVARRLRPTDPGRTRWGIEPFTEGDLRNIWNSLDRKCARRLFQKCKERYDAIAKAGAPAAPEAAGSADDAIRRRSEKAALPQEAGSDSEWIGRLSELLQVAARSGGCPIRFRLKKVLNGKVVPEHLAFEMPGKAGTRRWAIACCNKSGYSLTARLKNWLLLSQRDPSEEFLLFRSTLARKPNPSTAGYAILQDFGSLHHRPLTPELERRVLGLHEALVAVEEGEVWSADEIVSRADFDRYFQRRGTRELLMILGLPLPDLGPTEAVSAGLPKTSAVQALTTVAPAAGEVVLARTREVSPDTDLFPARSPEPRLEPFHGRPREGPRAIAAGPAAEEGPVPRREPPPAVGPDFSASPAEIEICVERLSRFVRDYSLPLDVQGISPSDAILAPHLMTLLVKILPGTMPKAIEKHEVAASMFFQSPVRIVPVIEKGRMAFEIERKDRMPWLFGQALRKLGPPDPRRIEIPLGIDSLGQFQVFDFFDPGPNLLIGGAAGSGKSNFLNCLVASLILRYRPQQAELTICDVKQVDFDLFRKVHPEHVKRFGASEEEIVDLLMEEKEAMDRRYSALREAGARKWSEFREGRDEPYRFVIIDEVAELFSGREADRCQELVQSLAQKGRAAGIGLVLCSQHPKADVINSRITANLNNRVAFRLQTHQQSQVVIEQSGAENLQGKGDCLARIAGHPLRRYLVPYFDREFEEWFVEQVRRQGAIQESAPSGR